jgi:hypothetical protein
MISVNFGIVVGNISCDLISPMQNPTLHKAEVSFKTLLKKVYQTKNHPYERKSRDLTVTFILKALQTINSN